MTDALNTWSRNRRTATDGTRRDTLFLLIGCLALTAAIGLAHFSPATGYEISVYTESPVAFWAAVIVAMACALFVGLFQSASHLRTGALVLGAEAFLTVVAIPLVRGYEFYGAGDALSHMGWIRNVLREQMALAEIIYPGVHTLSIYYHQLLGLSLGHAMLLSVATFTSMFVVFVPLVVYTLTQDRDAAVVGAFSAMMVLPINNISAHLDVFPSTMALFFFPFLLLLAIVAFTHQQEVSHPNAVDALLAVASAGIVLVHPQQAANVLLVMASMTVAVLVYRFWTGDRSFHPLYGHTIFLAVLLVAWGLTHGKITRTAVAYIDVVAALLLSGTPPGSSAVTQRTGSLSDIGVSPVEIFLKLFLASLVYIVLTTGLFGQMFSRVVRTRREGLRPVVFLGVGLVPVGIVTLLYMAGDLQTIYFRFIGFIMALVTIFGAIALTRGLASLSTRGLGRGAVAVGAVAVAALIALSLATVYPSPFIYQPNSHVTDMEMSGHEMAFAHENESIEYVGLRTGPDRFRDAIEGTFSLESGATRREARVPYGSLDENMTTVFGDSRYLVVAERDLQRETIAYKNLRYSERGLERIPAQRGVNRVVSNGDFRLYLVDE